MARAPKVTWNAITTWRWPVRARKLLGRMLPVLLALPLSEAREVTPASSAAAAVHAAEKGRVVSRFPPLRTADSLGTLLNHPAFRGAITYYTSYQGLMYNSQKVPADKVPKTLKDLANPQWKGKIGLNRGTDAWPRWAFVLGNDKVFADLRAILKNGALQGQYSDLQNRYLLGEIWMAFSISSYMNAANEKGVPTKWQCIELGEVQNFSLSVRKGARHPNAAKLVALYLASPQGAKFTLEESNAGNLFYPGNYENDIRMQNKKQGISDIFIDRNPQIIDFYTGKEFEKWEKEVDMIMKMGG